MLNKTYKRDCLRTVPFFVLTTSGCWSKMGRTNKVYRHPINMD
ncbi:hypothetical protein SUBVAR_06515 [Subdoligranulum variabile DSM 15176]|uniref:Lipoprotein n=1 Tax=Subdoligranulum variabile DSM 15176 TaxID=411471 RepID=D1PQ47_9FIRM|nr:hypothetical protein SUBVAR_06515 [Subdoligranulum variabile DSM 15176]